MVRKGRTTISVAGGEKGGADIILFPCRIGNNRLFFHCAT